MRFCLAVVLAFATSAFAALDDSLTKLTSVSREGQGNEAASDAWKQVVKTGPEALLPLLRATGKGNVVADNWLRLAANTIADEAVSAKKSLPLGELEDFLKETTHPSSARVLAFDIIQQADKAKADTIEPTLLNDPAQELRRGAVQRLIDQAKLQDGAKSGADASVTYKKALDAARDEDQVKVIADALDKLGVKVDLPKHFGFLMKWQVIGPFDNTNREGFATVFPPEKEINLDASYEGKPNDAAPVAARGSRNVSPQEPAKQSSRMVKWQPYETQSEQGKLDFNKPLGMLKQTTAYAYTTFNAPEARDAEIRLGCKNGWKVWLNGELLFGRDEYHRGAQMDQYKLKCHLKKGANAILVKCCQNEQTEAWTVEWEFQLRVCDATGTAIAAVK